eukprot:gene18258-21850_t
MGFYCLHNEVEQFLYASSILDRDQVTIIKTWCNAIDKPWTLLYRGSEDGFSATKFHELCNLRGPTVTILRSTNGCVFGGYGASSWDSHSGYFGGVKESFLFTLVNVFNIPPTKYSARPGGVSTQYGYEKAMAVFGSGKGFDIYISDACNEHSTSYSDFSSCAFADTTGRGVTTFAGTSKFQIEEMEVYSIAK